MSSYCANEGIFAFQYKSAEEFLPDKKALPDLNLQAINLKFAQIVALYKAYNL